MHVSFEELPKTARVWVYQADRTLSKSEQALIDAKSQTFFEQWAAHGNPLRSSFKIVHDKFLIISVDEHFNQASGCSIDASVALVRQLEQELSINFFDRTRVSFMEDDKIFDSPMSELKELISKGTISNQTLTFNNLVQTIDELENNWIVPAESSWLKRYF